jgi:hypothetical protein
MKGFVDDLSDATLANSTLNIANRRLLASGKGFMLAPSPCPKISSHERDASWQASVVRL